MMTHESTMPNPDEEPRKNEVDECQDELLQELNKWLNDAISVERNVPTNRLYHYTSVSSFSAILASNQFWMTSYKHLNDPTEYVYSDNVIQKSLESRKSEFRHDELSMLRSLLGFEEGASFTAVPFVISFSEDCDSLYQWRAYAEGGFGVNIGIEPPTDGDRYIRNLSKVIYSVHEQNDLMNKFVDEYLSICKQYQYDQKLVFNAIANLFQMIMHVRLRFKHIAYQIENEWRYANYPWMKQSKFRWDKRGLIQFFAENSIRDDDDRLPIREIWLGPKVNREEGSEAVSRMLVQHGYDPEKITVKASTVPLK